MVSEYIPGDKATSMAALVICNGGSLTTYQAIQNGTPVLGIVSNLDQHLNMSYLSRAGLGESIRSEKAEVKQIRKAVVRLLGDPKYGNAAKKARQVANRCNSLARFSDFVQEALGM
jgi:UDP:flavonoid glycosyltransferase YjiC (YdhE family)